MIHPFSVVPRNLFQFQRPIDIKALQQEVVSVFVEYFYGIHVVFQHIGQFHFAVTDEIHSCENLLFITDPLLRHGVPFMQALNICHYMRILFQLVKPLDSGNLPLFQEEPERGCPFAAEPCIILPFQIDIAL